MARQQIAYRICRPFEDDPADDHYWDATTGEECEGPIKTEFTCEQPCQNHVVHFEDFNYDDVSCDGEPGPLTGHPALVTCSDCLQRMRCDCLCTDCEPYPCECARRTHDEMCASRRTAEQ